MITIDQLHANLTSNTQAGILTLTTSLVDSDNIVRLLDSLPDQQLVIEETQIERITDSITVTGSLPDNWVVRGLPAELTNLSVRFVFTSDGSNAVLQATLMVDALLSIQGIPLSLNGSLDDQNRFDLMLNDTSSDFLTLNDIADYVAGENATSLLPVGETLFDAVQITAVQLQFSFEEDLPTHFSITSNTVTDWEIIQDIVTLISVGATINLIHNTVAGQSSRTFGGVIHAELAIGTESFAVALPLQSGNFWELIIIPGEGNLLPNLITIAEFVGGSALGDTVQTGIEAIGLGEITIDGVHIGFNLSSKSLTYVSLESHLTLLGAQINLLTQLPDFNFDGGLDDNSELRLNDIVTHYFGQADSFTNIVVADLSFSGMPDDGSYSLDALFEELWTIDLGPGSINLDEVVLELNRTVDGVTGEISSRLNIAGVNVMLVASQTEQNVGWQFSGMTGRNQQIPIGALITDLVSLFGTITLPSAIAGLTVENLAVSFNTATRDFTFTAEGILPIDNQEVDITLLIDITRQEDETYTKRFSGHIMIGGLQFDLLFVQDAASNHFVAVYSHTAEAQPLDVQMLVTDLSDTVADYIPDSLEIDLKNVLFAYRQDETTSQFVLGLDIGTGFNLSNLPLVGEIIAEDQTISVDDLQIIVASTAVTPERVADFNGLLPDGVTPLPDRMLDEGINIAAMINFGGSMELLNLPVRGGTAEPPAPTMPTPTPSAIPVATADNAKWYTLQKSFGPVHFERVGVQYQNSALLFLLDASLSAVGLTLTLDGLGFGGSLNPFTPRFDLKGLGLDYRNGPLEIGGAFLRQQVTDGGLVYDEYDGAAVIRTEALTLSAVGSYARLNGQPSLFIYAVLDYPLGGPSFFFVTGLAAGFGYNRSLNVPDVGRVADFALVREAVSVSTGTTPSSLADTLNNLRNDVPIDLGQNFLAVGIKFTSFKLVDSFVLVTAAFGNRFELNILGLSTLVVPTPLPGATVTPLAEVQMALKASFIPDEGFLGVSAQLTDASYILSRACHLTGGFAFYSWFSGENAGDFVQTLGGYHPDFQVPAHYPRVPRLGFNWRVNSELSLKGEAYYALTPAALMAGGLLQGAWHSGRLMACFNVGADFLIAWKPYHYDARANADLTVHYTFSVFGIRKRISVDVGANLHMYGPEFSGNVHIRLSVVSFDIRFGDRSRTPQPIDWNTFRASFLPSDNEDVVNLVVADGLVQELTDESEELTGWIVSPKQFTLTTNSVIPAQTFTHGTEMIPGPEVGIGPMAVSADDFASTLHITVTTSDGQEVTTLAYEPVFKDAPAGLWGEQLLPDLNGTALIAGALAGFTIGPKDGPTAGTTMPIDRNQLQFSTDLAPSYDLTPLAPFVADTMLDESARRDAIRNELVNDTTITARTNLLAALDITEAVALSDDTADVFVIAPQISA